MCPIGDIFTHDQGNVTEKSVQLQKMARSLALTPEGRRRAGPEAVRVSILLPGQALPPLPLKSCPGGVLPPICRESLPSEGREMRFWKPGLRRCTEHREGGVPRKDLPGEGGGMIWGQAGYLGTGKRHTSRRKPFPLPVPRDGAAQEKALCPSQDSSSLGMPVTPRASFVPMELSTAHGELANPNGLCPETMRQLSVGGPCGWSGGCGSPRTPGWPRGLT